MEQLTYIPFKCKLKLSRQELATLSNMLCRLEHAKGVIRTRALAEWVVGKRMDFARRLLQPRPHYSLTLNAIDAWAATTILSNASKHDEYEEALAYKILDQVARLM